MVGGALLPGQAAVTRLLLGGLFGLVWLGLLTPTVASRSASVTATGKAILRAQLAPSRLAFGTTTVRWAHHEGRPALIACGTYSRGDGNSMPWVSDGTAGGTLPSSEDRFDRAWASLCTGAVALEIP